MTDLRSAGVAETARLVAAGEVPAREVVEQALARIQAGDAGAQRVLGGARRARRSPRPTRGTLPARPVGPAARRTDRDQGGDRRRRHGDDVRRPGQLHAGRRRRRGGPPAARPPGAVVDRQDHDAGVRRVPVHRVRRPRRHPQPVGPDPHPRRLQRRYGGRRVGRDGPGRHGRRRRRLDPDPERQLRAVRPQAAARPGRRPPRSRTCGGRSAPPAR